MLNSYQIFKFHFQSVVVFDLKWSHIGIRLSFGILTKLFMAQNYPYEQHSFKKNPQISSYCPLQYLPSSHFFVYATLNIIIKAVCSIRLTCCTAAGMASDMCTPTRSQGRQSAIPHPPHKMESTHRLQVPRYPSLLHHQIRIFKSTGTYLMAALNG